MNVFLGKTSTVACGSGYFVVSVASLVYMLVELAMPVRASMNPCIGGYSGYFGEKNLGPCYGFLYV